MPTEMHTVFERFIAVHVSFDESDYIHWEGCTIEPPRVDFLAESCRPGLG